MADWGPEIEMGCYKLILFGGFFMPENICTFFEKDGF